MAKDINIVPKNDSSVVELISDLRQIIDEARSHVAATANYELTMMYWHIGTRINRDVLGNERAEYGKQIVPQVATQLQAIYGTKGFELRNIRRMMQFATLFPDIKIVSPLVTQLSWSHFLLVMPLKDELQREFYLTMAASDHWSKRTLQAKIDGMLYSGESVLIPRKGSLNNIMLVDDSFWTIDTMFYSIPRMKDVAKIAYFYLKSLDMYNLNIGAAVPSMTVQTLSTLKLLLPNAEIRSIFEPNIFLEPCHYFTPQ